MQIEKRFLNTKEMAVYLCLSKDTIRAWIKTGRIPCTKLGRSVRFDLRRIEPWLKKREFRISVENSQMNTTMAPMQESEVTNGGI